MKHYVFLNVAPDVEKSKDILIYYFGHAAMEEFVDVYVKDLPERAFYEHLDESVKLLTTTIDEVYFKGDSSKSVYDIIHSIKLRKYASKFVFNGLAYTEVYNPVSGLKLSGSNPFYKDITSIVKHGIHHLLVWIECGFHNKRVEAGIPSWAIQTESPWLALLISFYGISPKNEGIPDRQFEMDQALIKRDCRFDILQNEDLRFVLCEGTAFVLRQFSLNNKLTSVFYKEDLYSVEKWKRILDRLERE